ncbi:MAG: major facilitator superfamily 1 [Deltaproteobacteria bacterium]|nr:major facilitator superfamily 1 [Deltaproteobacteria bacterium]
MVALVSALRVLGGGLHNYGFTVFFLPLSQDLGLSRAATSLAFSLARVEGAIEGPFVGYFIDRFGPRPMILVATILTGAGYILFAWVDSYTNFLIVYLGIISLSFTPGFVHAAMAVGNTWFIRYRARAMTVISSAVPIGGTLLTPLLALAVQAWGWRSGAILAGTLFLLIGIPIGMGVRHSPESMGLLPDGDAPTPAAPGNAAASDRGDGTSAVSDPTLRQAMKTWVFWLFVISMTVRVGAYSTISVHFVPIMVWKGLTQEHAAVLLGGFAFLNWAAHYVIGPLADAMNRPKLLTACMIAAGASMLLLIWGDGVWPLWLFTILFTAIDASFPVVWATIGDFFGRKNFATIRGTMSFFYTWGSVVGPVIAGAVYDRSQSYVATLWGICAAMLLGAFLTALLIKPWNAVKPLGR